MGSTPRAALVALGLLAVAVAAAGPASAGTAASITVTGGALTLSVPDSAGSLGSRSNTVGGGVVSGPLGEVQVDDARGAASAGGWVASVISTAFTPPAGPAIPASAVAYAAGAITGTGTATFTAKDPSDLTGLVQAVTATAVTGDNSARWVPTISVTVPGGSAAAVYSATITHSVV